MPPPVCGTARVVCASECALASEPGAAGVQIVAVCEGRYRDLNRRPRDVRLVGWAGRGSRHRRASRGPGRGAGRRRT